VASGRAFSRFQAALGVVGLLALGVTITMATGRNPWPALQSWLDRTRVLSEPAPAWSVKVGDQPSSAVVARGAVVIASSGLVGGYALNGGGRLWTHEVPWSAVAGVGSRAVVVAGRTGRGYEAYAPDTGAPRWSDATALGVWTFADLVVGLACPRTSTCTLTARDPDSGNVRWHAELPGDGRPLAGLNHRLSGIRALGRTDPAPQPVPPLLGFPVEDQVQVFDSGDGTRLRAYPNRLASRATVVADRVLLTSATPKPGADQGCRYAMEARDPRTGRSAWHRDGYDLHTSAVLGCEQRSDPTGGGGLLAGTGPDGRGVLLAPDTGAEVLHTDKGESLVNVNDRLAVVRTDGKRKVRVVDLGSGASWTRVVDGSTGVVLGPGVVVLTDPGTGQLLALGAGGQVLVDAASGASVLGYADSGVLINIGRQVGLLMYGR
jgi:outer membrane protein assembly factor BamB